MKLLESAEEDDPFVDYPFNHTINISSTTDFNDMIDILNRFPDMLTTHGNGSVVTLYFKTEDDLAMFLLMK